MVCRPTTSGATLVLLMVSSLCGCSKPPPSPSHLAQQIATADHVVLTNFSSSLTFSNAEAQNLVQAVSHSKRRKMDKDTDVLCPSGFFLEFYNGTNLLARMPGHDNHFQAPDFDFYVDA